MCSSSFRTPSLAFLSVVLAVASACLAQQSKPPTHIVEFPQYAVLFLPSEDPANPPRLSITSDHETTFVVPVVSGLDSDTQREHLSAILATQRTSSAGTSEIEATVTSNLWSDRRFVWRFFSDRIEFQQFASGHGK